MILLDLPLWFVLLSLFVLGAIVGSFLNVCVYRIPTQDDLFSQLRSLSDRPSQCRRCQANIAWYDNVPIFGWLKLRGRCRACKAWISPRYPLIELLNALLFVGLFWFEVPVEGRLTDTCLFNEFGPQEYPGLGWMSATQFVLIRFVFHLVLVEALLVASLIDIDHRIIPDATTIPAMLVALIASTALGRTHIVPVWFQGHSLERTFAPLTPAWMHPLMEGPSVPAWIEQMPHLHGAAVSLAGFLIGGGLVWTVRLLGFWILRREAMGFGDVILMAMIGTFIGWQPTIIAFVLAPVMALSAVAVGWIFFRDRYIPYGPYLSLGTLVTILAWQPLWIRSRHIFELGVLLVPIAGIMLLLFVGTLGLLQVLKRLLGISIEPEEELIWTAADQNQFFSGEKVDLQTGGWRTSQWDGNHSARGTMYVERWRHGSGPQANGHVWRR